MGQQKQRMRWGGCQPGSETGRGRTDPPRETVDGARRDGQWDWHVASVPASRPSRDPAPVRSLPARGALLEWPQDTAATAFWKLTKRWWIHNQGKWPYMVHGWAFWFPWNFFLAIVILGESWSHEEKTQNSDPTLGVFTISSEFYLKKRKKELLTFTWKIGFCQCILLFPINLMKLGSRTGGFAWNNHPSGYILVLFSFTALEA